MHLPEGAKALFGAPRRAPGAGRTRRERPRVAASGGPFPTCSTATNRDSCRGARATPPSYASATPLAAASATAMSTTGSAALRGSKTPYCTSVSRTGAELPLKGPSSKGPTGVQHHLRVEGGLRPGPLDGDATHLVVGDLGGGSAAQQAARLLSNGAAGAPGGCRALRNNSLRSQRSIAFTSKSSPKLRQPPPSDPSGRAATSDFLRSSEAAQGLVGGSGACHRDPPSQRPSFSTVLAGRALRAARHEASATCFRHGAFAAKRPRLVEPARPRAAPRARRREGSFNPRACVAVGRRPGKSFRYREEGSRGRGRPT